MGELDVSVAHRDQAGIGERRQHPLTLVYPLQLGEGHPTASQRAVLPRHQPQHHVARRALLGLGELGVGSLGQAPDRPAHAAAAAIGVKAQGVAIARAPQLQQGRGEEGQPPGLVGHVGHQGVDERVLDRQSGPGGGPLDRLGQLLAVHRSDQGVAVAQQFGETRVGAEPAIEVGTQRAEDEHATLGLPSGVREPVQEARSVGLARAQGEDLLELIHRDHDPLGGREPPQGLLQAGATDRAVELRTGP